MFVESLNTSNRYELQALRELGFGLRVLQDLLVQTCTDREPEDLPVLSAQKGMMIEGSGMPLHTGRKSGRVKKS